MVKTVPQIPRFAAWLAPAIAVLGLTSPVMGADRTYLLVPRAHDAASSGPHDAASGGPDDATGDQLPAGVFADEAFGEGASDGWKAYVRLWKAHYQDPSDASIRRFLGLPLKEAFELKARRGRSAPRFLGWAPGSYAQVDTPHFVIYSRAKEAPSKHVAEDLERCYWAWTQMFFPLWEASVQVSGALGELSADQSVKDFLANNSSRITIRRKLRVVLFRDAAEYQETLGPENPGIEQSTGFYHNAKQTIYLYAAQSDDAATRRHELVHQLFREATRSGLGQDMPGEKEGFWLIEGIAGYCESLFLGEKFATVGGWDAPRMQFARFRMLSGGDVMAMDELKGDGRLAAQKRQDLARWYAHAIAQTHHLLDGGDAAQRRWVYQQLAKRYKVRCDLPAVDTKKALSGVDRSTDRFLKLDDARLVASPIHEPPKQLVLAECQITDNVLRKIPPSPSLRWLDLTRLPIGNDAVRWLAPQPKSVEQLRLEATKVDAGLIQWLRRATNMTELDLSWTPMDDTIIDAVTGAKNLTVLYMTGTKVSDKSIDAIAKMPNLQSVDLQRTQVTDGGIARLRAAKPKLDINPFQLRPMQKQ